MSRDLLLLGAGVGSFNPAAIAGLQLWLKANALALNDGDPVGTWADASGQAHDVTQATASKKPTYRSNLINGYPVLRFDGVDDKLTGPALSSLVSASAFTYFAVFQASTIIRDSAQAFNNDGIFGDTGGYWGLSARLTPLAYVFTDGTGEKKIGLSIALATPYLVMGRLDTGNLYASLNGGSESSVACGNVAVTTGLIETGACFTNNYLTGDLAELLVYNTALSAGNVSSILSALRGKYGI